MAEGTIIVADDHPIVLDNLVSGLRARKPGWTVVGAADYPSLLAVLYDRPSPDAVVQDLGMPGMNPALGVAAVRQANPAARILAFTADERPATCCWLQKAGVCGLVYKSAPPGALYQAVDAVLAGERSWPSPVRGGVDTPREDWSPVEDILAPFRLGVLLVDAAAKVSYANRAGAAMLAAADGLGADRLGRICGDRPDQTARLRRVVAGVLGQTGRTVEALAVERASSPRPLWVLVRRLRPAMAHLAQGMAAVYVADPDHTRSLSADLLSAALGLTSREAELLALLAEGARLDDAARQMNVAITTVRSHLRSLFIKTDTTNQANLVALVARSPFWILGEG